MFLKENKADVNKYFRSRLILLIVYFVMIQYQSEAQFVKFAWVKSIGSTGSEIGKSITTDTLGNVYHTGYFEGTVDFDPGPGVSLLTAQGSYDSYISKQDAAGNFLWVRQIGGNGSDRSVSITSDRAGYIYTTGTFQDSIKLDSTGGGVTLVSKGGAYSSSIFICKTDINGNLIWAKVFGGQDNSNIWPTAITVDPGGNVYTIGGFTDTIDFDPGASYVPLISFPSKSDIFIAKLDALGNYLWTKQISGNEVSANAMTLDATGNIYTTGGFKDTVDFDPGTGIANFISSAEQYVSYVDMFITKLDASGNYIWTRQIKTEGIYGFNRSAAIAVDDIGNIFTSGDFLGTVDFDPGMESFSLSTFGNPALTKTDIFLLKLGPVGNFLWVRQMGGLGREVCNSLALDIRGNIFLTGSFDEKADFDPGPAMAHLTPPLTGTGDNFITALTASGDYLWAKQMGGGGPNGSLSNVIHTDKTGNIYTIGCFSGTGDFNPGSSNHILTSVGIYDVFVLKMSACNDTSNAYVSATACDSFTLGGVSYMSTGKYMQSKINAAGCDSIILIDLKISYSTDTMSIIACDSYLLDQVWYRNTGFYKINTNLWGCKAEVLDLTINKLDVSVSIGADGSLISNVAGANSYQWIDCAHENSLIPYAVDQSLTPVISGSYAVIINKSGCTDTSECINLTANALEKYSLSDVILLYPNPNNGILSIAFPFPVHNAAVSLTNFLGQVILRSTVEKRKYFSIDITKYPAGIYFVDIMVSGNLVRKKVIKK